MYGALFRRASIGGHMLRLMHHLFPASFNQEWRLAWEEVATESGHQHISHAPCAMRVRGPMDIAALEWAVSVITQRHAALRTTFVHNRAYSSFDRRIYLHAFRRLGVL